MNQSKLEANTCSRHEARENVREQVVIGFGFNSEWLRKWREILQPITEPSNATQKQRRITFGTRVKIALKIDKIYTQSFIDVDGELMSIFMPVNNS